MDTLLSFLFERASDFFCVLDKNGFIRHTNTAFRKMLGYSEEELAKIKINALSHPADVRRRGELINMLIKKKEIKGYEARIKGIDGRFYNINWSLYFNSANEMVYASGTNLTNKLNGTNQGHLADNIQHILQSFSEGFFILDNKWHITAFNPAFLAISGLNNKQLKNISLKKIHSLGMPPDVIAVFASAFKSDIPAQLQYFNNFFKRWLSINIYPYKNEIMVFIRDINSVKIQQLILALEKRVLELNASDSFALPQTINELLKGIEEIFPDMICSVLEVDKTQEKVYHMAAPRLPEGYCKLINGSSIGPKAGSCGTSAYHRTQIIVSDIDTDPLWDDYREIAHPFGFKACWSTPVVSSRGSHVLATFAIYYTTAREPKSEELQLIERTSNILRVLIENKRNQDSVKEQNKMLQEIAAISSHEIRRPVATILGLVNLFDRNNPDNPMNREIVDHLDITAQELDGVIHAIVEKTVHLRDEL
jgi:PAS domain S-box-containing protein